MNIKFDKANMETALRSIGAAISQRTTLPILSNVLVIAEGGKLRISSTDLELAFGTSIPAEIVDDGGTTIPATKFTEIISNLSGDIEVVVSGQKIVLKSGKARFSLVGLATDDYPKLPDFDTDKAVSVKAALLVEMVSKVLPSIGEHDSRRTLNGALWQASGKRLTMVSTDGKQLATVSRDFPEASFSAIVPRQILQEVARQLSESDDVLVSVSESRIGFKFKDTVLHSRLIEGSFPAWGNVVPSKSDSKMVASTKELEAITKRASLCADFKMSSVKWKLSDGKLLVTAASQGIDFEDEIDVEYSGSFEVVLNSGYIRACLNALKSDKVSVDFTTNVKPVLFQPVGDSDYKYVVMPMRV